MFHRNCLWLNKPLLLCKKIENDNKNEREYQDKGEICQNAIMKSTRKIVCQIIHDASYHKGGRPDKCVSIGLLVSLTTNDIKHLRTRKSRNIERWYKDQNWQSWDEIVNQVPRESRVPVAKWVYTADKLHVLCFVSSFLHQKHHKARGQEGHTKQQVEGDQEPKPISENGIK